MYSYISQFFGGALDPAWPHIVLITGTVVGGALVGLGVVLEAPKILSIPVAAVIVGVVIEAACTLLLFGFDEGISTSQQSQIAVATDRATDAGFDAALANNAAAEANEHAAQLESENLKLEAQIQPRRLTTDDIAKLKAAVTPFSNRQISVWSYGLDLEGRFLATQILSALNEAHVPTVDSIGHMLSSVVPRIGVIVTGPDDEPIAALLKALERLSPVRGPLPGGFTTYGPGQPPIVPAEIFVGIKPIKE